LLDLIPAMISKAAALWSGGASDAAPDTGNVGLLMAQPRRPDGLTIREKAVEKQ
jgi:hypothetical protein